MSDRGTFKKSGIPMLHPGASVFGDIYFVSKLGGDGGAGADDQSGKSPDAPFLTVNHAITQIGTDDTIIVGRGQYKEDEAIAFTSRHHGARLIADATGPNKALTRTEFRQYGNVAANIITIEGAHNVEIAGFRLTPYGGTTYGAIMVAQTANSYGAYIHDNYFYAAVQTGTQMKCGTASYNADSIALVNNEFWKGGTAGAVSTNSPMLMTQALKAYVAYNTITGIGSGQWYFYLADAVSNSKYFYNHFFAAEGGAGCFYNGAAGAATVGDYCFSNNYGINCAADKLISDPDDTCCGLNYVNETAETSD